MTSKKFINLCKNKVVEFHNNNGSCVNIINEDVYVVWYCNTLQHQKALFGTAVPDGMYYEITYNGDKDELYFDAYKKWTKITFREASKIVL